MGYQKKTYQVEEHTLCLLIFDHIKVPHAIPTRLGGLSQGPWQGLNLGFSSGDDKEVVAKNRSLLARVLGTSMISPLLKMTHGSEVVEVTTPVQPFYEADACWTREAGLPLSITTADCVPILYWCPITGAVALAHAGWRGTVASIAGKVVEALREQGSPVHELKIGVGPAISPEHFLVHEDVRQPFVDRFGERDWIRAVEKERFSIDLWQANVQILEEYGILSDQIVVARECTFAQPENFYSYRRDQGRTGRLLSVIESR